MVEKKEEPKKEEPKKGEAKKDDASLPLVPALTTNAPPVKADDAKDNSQ